MLQDKVAPVIVGGERRQCARKGMCVQGSCAQRFVYSHNRVHLYTQSMDTGESPKVNWITEQESERLLCLLDLTPDLDKVLLALRSRLRGGDGEVMSCLGCVLNLHTFFSPANKWIEPEAEQENDMLEDEVPVLETCDQDASHNSMTCQVYSSQELALAGMGP